MADTPQTLAHWAAYGGVNYLAKTVINTLIANRPLLGMTPYEDWPGTTDYSWVLNSTGPTITWGAETAAHYSSASARYKLTTYLSYGHGDIEIPIHSSSTMDAAMSMEMEEALDLIRNMGISMSSKLFTGDYMTEANVTIVGSGIAATPGVDAVVKVSENHKSGVAAIKYTHATTSLQYRAPGSTTYGAAVDISGGDGNFTLYDGDDTTVYVTLTIDITDYTTGAVDLEHPGALSIQRPENIAGLRQLAVLDSNQVATASTNGDTATLTMLDELDEMTLGPKDEKIFVMNPRTRRKIKSLIGASGGMKQGEWQGQDLSKWDLNYEGIPVVADSNVSIAETQGTETTCGAMYCLRLNKDVGYHLLFGHHRGPNFGTMSAVSDHDAIGGNVQLPVYMRRLGEATDYARYKWRISVGMAAALKRSSSCAIRYGVTS